MIDGVNFLGLIIASFIFLITPGVGVALLLARIPSHGVMLCFVMAMGMVTGDMVYAISVLSALSSVSDIVAPYMFYIRIFGAGYLIYIGIQQMKKGVLNVPKEKTKSNIAKSYLLGCGVALTNPKTMLFYLGFLPLFINIGEANFYTGFISTAGLFIGSLLGAIVIVVSGRKLIKLMKSKSKAMIINRIIGILMIIIGISLVL